MEKPEVGPEIREALAELAQYLSDALPPLMVAGSVDLLTRQPAALAAEEIRAWTAAQYQGRSAGLPVSDFLFHALKKIHLLVELKLVPPDRTLRFLGALLPILEAVCPEEDRELLRGNVSRLGSASTILTSPVETIYRQAGSEKPLASRGRGEAGVPAAAAPTGAAPAGPPGAAAAPPPRNEDVARGLARFGLRVDRLEKSVAKGPGRRAPDALTAQLLATAATASRSGRELEENLARLSRLGVEVPPTDVLFRKLSDSLPGWGVPVNPDADETIGPGGRGSVVGAMRRLVTLSADPAEGGKRFREIVYAAIEQLNEGSLGRAVTMIGLAEQIIRKEKVEKPVAQAIRARAHESVDTARLRALAEKPENHFGLRNVLEFFPAFSPEGLLESLRDEKRRDARRTLLALLEVHGPTAREAALRVLSETSSGGGDQDWYFLRNLLYVLRKVPRTSGPLLEAELDHLFRLSDPGRPAPLVKEALANLGAARTEKAEQVLVARLAQLEAAAAKAGPAATPEQLQLVDRACAALVRHGTPTALRALADHGLRAPTAPGAPGRLSLLSAHDLSSQPDLVDRLLKALRAALPVKILGVVVAASADADARRLVKALSGTTSASVRSAFEEISRKFPDREFGRDAGRALEALGEARRPPEAAPASSLAGDLEVFGLPTLLQTFEQTGATGVLSLKDPKGALIGTVSLEAGAIRGATAGRLAGSDAFFQILERPIAASFVFARAASLRPDDIQLSTPQSVMGKLLEGMRRYDELQRASALVPDGARFRPTQVRPTRLDLEADPALPGTVWGRALSGASAVECEAATDADAFRVRRLLVHWVEEGALQVVSE